MASRKTVINRFINRKNRQKKGLVTFKSYQLITIKKIKDSSLKIFKENFIL